MMVFIFEKSSLKANKARLAPFNLRFIRELKRLKVLDRPMTEVKHLRQKD